MGRTTRRRDRRIVGSHGRDELVHPSMITVQQVSSELRSCASGRWRSQIDVGCRSSLAAVREWAIGVRHEVRPRGLVPEAALSAYEAA